MVPPTVPSAQSSSYLPGKPPMATVRKVADRVLGCVGTDPLELHEQLGHVVGVGGVLTGVPGRVDPGSSAQGLDLEAGVVGHGRQPGGVGTGRGP